MDSDDPALQPVIVLRVVIRSPDLDTFVAKYARFIKDDRIFIFTKSSQPAGTRVRFTLELADGQPLIHGEGTVTRIRAETGDPSKPPGMELKFMPLDELSRELVGRMLAAREQAEHFRDETTDAQTKVRDGTAPNRAFEEAPPTLPPLQKTGKMSTIDLNLPRQDESGAVTLAQTPPGVRPSQTLEAPDTQPSGGFAVPRPEPAAPAPLGDKQSGGFSSPTPLPAPIPASASEEFNVTAPQTRLDRAALARGNVDSGEAPFAAIGPAPPFAEAFRAPMPGGTAVTPPTGTVPANPFSQVSDTAIEYFVEWSLEQSTAPRPKVAAASFANVAMATPRAEKRRSMRAPLLGGLALGLAFGVPLGGAAMLYLAPKPAPVIVERMPEPLPRPVPRMAAVVAPDLGLAPRAGTSTLASAGVAADPTTGTAGAPNAAELPAAEPPAAKEPTEAATAKLVVGSRPSGATVSVDGEARGKTPLTLMVPAGEHKVALARERYATVTRSVDVPGRLEVTLRRPPATLHVESDPPGGEVIVEGRPRGKTPVDVTLDAFHHYDVQVMLLGTKPWHKRVALRPPQTDVTAKLSVVRNP